MENKQKENAIAIITARGGSKRIPKKNIKMFCGKPIIAYSIEAALKSGIFSEVMVSTDSEEIAEIAKKYGAKVPFMRSQATSGDYATTSEVLLEVLGRYEKLGNKYDYMCCIYPTAPFVTVEKLVLGLNLLKNYNAIEAMPVVQFSYPPQRSFVINNNFMEYKEKKYITTRSQDLRKEYHDAGQFYFYNVPKYLDVCGKIESGIVPIIVSEMEVQDIDNEDDWKLAELKYRLLKESV